jgi:tetratricopeptide (TPR) repeat protein
VSRTIFDNGAIVWMALLAALVWAAIRVRRQYPLACFGGLFFLIALAPTSSIVPIADPMVERRAYLPLVGLILIGCELCRRVRFPSARLAGVVAAAGLIVLSGLCHARNQLWGRPIELFASAAKHSKNKERPYRWLTSYLVREGRCAEAIQYLQYAERAFPRNDWIEMWWGGALECMGRREEAMKRLLAAAEIRPTSETYERIGLLLGAMNRSEDAGKALRLAVALDPNSATAHDSLGLWSESIGDFTLAAAEYERSVSLDPGNTAARAGIIRARALKSGPVLGGDRPAGDR